MEVNIWKKLISGPTGAKAGSPEPNWHRKERQTGNEPAVEWGGRDCRCLTAEYLYRHTRRNPLKPDTAGLSRTFYFLLIDENAWLQYMIFQYNSRKTL